jgi:hypothetical protein
LLHLWCVRKTTSLVCVALAILTSCSRQKPISRDELQSKLRSAESIAAETVTLLDYVREKRATNVYAKGHIEYLSADLGRTAKELQEALPPAGTEQQFTEGQKQLDTLLGELRNIHGRMSHPDDLSDEQERIAAIRKALQQVASSL